ncbi:Kelch repeat-containing protein [Catenulispora rubra]|uniref:Kelch repeat-containing protein n=1 Tax=Catenulispora rubra TaxID=280293 RepID=UPI00189206C2|nr:kelch repeat-containing protein [Catenulispora rubra]
MFRMVRSGRRTPQRGGFVAVLSAAALAWGMSAPAAAAGAIPKTAPTTAGDSAAGTPTFQSVCGVPKPGTFSCFALRRTDVKQSTHAQALDAAPAGYGPADLRSAYSLPSDGGSGQTIAIVDAYDDPTAEADLATYRQQFGLPACTSAGGCFSKVDQTGGTQYPPPNGGWAGEISLDLDMVSAIAPNAHILLVEATDPSSTNLGASVDEAVALGAKFVSNSYGSEYTSVPGSGEDPADPTQLDPYYDHPGVAVIASSGDSSYGVAYPAASPYVTSVGGTNLTRAPGTARGWTESAWSGAGSGCSLYEPKPAFQRDTGCAHRAVADVSAVADPNTGVAVYQSGVWSVFGGTSVAAPIIAGVYADAGTPAAGTNPNSYPYSAGTGLNDVNIGTNGGCTVAYLCNATSGYDGPTGLGSPNGLQAFRTGPHGTLTGTVKDRRADRPIVGAEVSDGTDVTHTDSQGHYSLALPAGRRDLTITAYGYKTDSTTANVEAGTTATKNIGLTQVPSATVSGTVTDGSGQGWPLYAEVSVNGDPNPVWTDPRTGRYTLTLPQNSDYTLDFAPATPGYDAVTKTVHVARSAQSVNVAATADPWQATAPGYKLTLTGSTETFDSTTSAPAGWSVVTAPGTPVGWQFDDPGQQGNQTGGSGGFAVADTNQNFLSSFNTALVTPVYDFSRDTRPEIAFDTMWWDNPYYQQIDVQASADGGATWSTVWTPDSEINAGEYILTDTHIDVPLTAYAGKSSVQLRFQYITTRYGKYWGIDDVFVGQRDFTPIAGGVVVGTARDANTGQGAVDAAVTDKDDPSVRTQTVANPNDPYLPGGSFSLFVPGLGKHVLTAAKVNYVSAAQTVNVRANSAVAANYWLKAGQLQVRPGSISASVEPGGHTRRTLTVTNTGSAPATLLIGQQAAASASASALAPNATQGAPLQRIPGSYAMGHIAGAPQTQVPDTNHPAPSPPDAWQNTQSFPGVVMDDVADAYNGQVYAGFGDAGLSFGDDTSGNLYVLNPTANTWTQLASASDGRQAPGHGVIGGKLYVSGGWTATGTVDSKLEVYDFAGNTWTTGASEPTPYAGAGSAVLDGKLYLVGGCGSTTCGTTDVSAYDPATDTWSHTAPYPESIAWTSCAAISDRLYCAGGTNASGANIPHTYVYDPATDTWSALPDMPTPLWGAAYAGADGMLVVSSGVTTGSVLTNQSEAFDPNTDGWRALPNATTATYRGAGALGFYKLGGSSAGILPTTDVEHLPGYAVDPSVTVPWLTESATRLTLQPRERRTITVTLDASASQSTSQSAEPGTYTAGLVFGSSTPYAIPSVAVTLTVADKG